MSEVSICNVALSYIRAGGINSLTETSAQAQQCALHYPLTRDQVLVRAPWGFNKGIALLALRTDTVFNWAYLYQYPSDCLRIDRLILNFSTVTSGTGVYRPRLIEDLYTPDLDRQIPYQVLNVGDQKVIAANYPELRIQYRKNITDTTLFDVEMAEAVSRLLASKIANALVGGELGRNYQKEQAAAYEKIVAEAEAAALNEEFTSVPESEFITIRN